MKGVLTLFREMIKKEQNQKFRKVKKLQKELQDLYREVYPTKALLEEIQKVREEFTEKERELVEKYMQKEIDLLKDKKLQLQE